ncbi:aspartate--ammonia ligase [Metabacillus crassostreae]|uniref:aspartate--ammonia ligase n=1 Tax=Metabacillus crassostreae TaxID=929098 RepID=UPI00195BF04C|nr:aspartate--ammonia ligase [Metabacillus crassostreae]MBM7606458.1 aspartate--ammonia ligase [Metabacillus crassostreae]
MTKSTTVYAGYKSTLDIMNTQIAINEVKDFFESKLSEFLDLTKVSSPLIVPSGKGINDNLNGVERMVSFTALDIEEPRIEIVQSLAKWKRIALQKFGFVTGEGLYTNMNAIRRDEKLDNLHSIYVDQWDWEKVINKEDRNINTLKSEVRKIYQAIKATELHMSKFHPALDATLPEDIYFITTQELEDLYPDINPKQREDEIAKKYGAVFIMEIGGVLRSGEKHDGRSPDYDDWKLNGDIVVWNPTLQRAFEISSMGIRVDSETLLKQLKVSDAEERENLYFHQKIINGILPQTIGGGIGQSRLCMFLLKKVHIGEVQASVWNEETLLECEERNIQLF